MQEKEYLLETAYGGLARVPESKVEQFLKDDEELRRKIKSGEAPATPRLTPEEETQALKELAAWRAKRAQKK